MAEPVRVLIADDHALFLQGIAGLLRERKDFSLVGEVRSGPEAIELCRQKNPDVVLMDVHMPDGDGVEAVRVIKANSETRILMLTISDRDEDLFSALEAGADGYLLKNVEPEQLYGAIHTVAAGQGVLSAEITVPVMEAAARSHAPTAGANLSTRQTQVLGMLAHGATTAEIAAELVISSSTVKTHIRHILDKLEASNRAEAVGNAATLGLLG